MLRTLIWAACAIAFVGLAIAAIGAVLALITGHVRWIELSWLSIAASLFVLAVVSLRPGRE